MRATQLLLVASLALWAASEHARAAATVSTGAEAQTAASEQAAAALVSQPKRKRPTCAPVYATIILGRRPKRVKLPMCSRARASAQSIGPVSSVYPPCRVGDAKCYCSTYKQGAVGYFSDNDPTVGCRWVLIGLLAGWSRHCRCAAVAARCASGNQPAGGLAGAHFWPPGCLLLLPRLC